MERRANGGVRRHISREINLCHDAAWEWNDAGEKYRERDFDSRLTGIKQTSIRIQQPANAAVAKKMLSGPKSKKAELDYHRREKTPTGRGWSAHSDRHFGKR